MKSSARLILSLFFCLLLLTQYQNCSSSSENTLFQSGNLENSSTVTSMGASDPGKPSISVSALVSPLRALPGENQISIAGRCNTAGRKYNYIEYSVVDSVSKRLLDLSASGTSVITSLRDAICENGRFYIVLPITGGAGGPDPAQSSYLLNVNFYFSNDPASFEPKVSTSASLVID